jgi:hypothetical protein
MTFRRPSLSQRTPYVLGCISTDNDETCPFSLSEGILIIPAFSQLLLFWIVSSGSLPPFLICFSVLLEPVKVAVFAGRGLRRVLSIGADVSVPRS